MISQPIASDLSYEVLKMRRRRLELTTPEIDSQNRRLYPLPSQMVQREAFIGSPNSVPDSFQGETLIHWPTKD